MDKAQIIKKFNNFREVCLRNAEDLLKAAKASFDAGIEHASFHLSVLALEEIGKIEIEAIRTMSLIHPSDEPLHISLDTEAHEKKLFFAFWGGSLVRQKQTKELLETDKRVANNLHNLRLLFLYTDPNNPQHWSKLMKKDEALHLYELAQLKFKLTQNSGGIDEAHGAEKQDENLVWFFKMQEDQRKRNEIWGHKSQEKLLELGDVKPWIKWLREVYEKNEQEMQELAKKEMTRQEPPEGDKFKPKWRIKIGLVTPSHSIRQANLKAFNDTSSWIKFLYRKEPHTLGLEFSFPKSLPVQALWEHGWGVARMFVIALNIGSRGFFWWNIKKDTSRYYEEIWDVENNAGVVVEMNPRLEMNWKDMHLVLRPADLSLTSLVFSYLVGLRKTGKEEHLNHYAAGISFLAKSDIHLRFEPNSFDEFFKALKIAMIDTGDWDGKEALEVAYQRATSWLVPEITEEMKKTFALGFKLEQEHSANIDLTNVHAIKNYCDTYFLVLAARHISEVEGKEVRFTVGEQPGDSE